MTGGAKMQKKIGNAMKIKKLLMTDQAPIARLNDSKKETEAILIKLLTAFLIFAALATVFTVASLSDAKASSVTGAVYDNLMTDEMAEYIAKNPGTYTEDDMQ